MVAEIHDQGVVNRIELHDWFQTNGRLKIRLNGNNNLVRIMELPVQCGETTIHLEHGCAVEIGGGCFGRFQTPPITDVILTRR
jgi:hypothetical protein